MPNPFDDPVFKQASDPFSDPVFQQAPPQQEKSAWRQLVDGIKNRDWGNTADVVASAAEHGVADIAGYAESALRNPLLNVSQLGNVDSLTTFARRALGMDTPVADAAHRNIETPTPQDAGDTYLGRGVEGAVSMAPFAAGAPVEALLSGVGQGVGGQAGYDLSGGNPLASLAGSVIGGGAPFAPRAIEGMRVGQAIRSGASNPDFSKMIDITMGSESRFNPDAVSPKGARGLMQVMPDTANDPGHGIRPSDGSKADDVRVGTQLFAKLLGKYDHDPEKAWAAYNWGEGRVDHALGKYGEDWLQHAPEETQKYVSKNMGKLGAPTLTGPAGPDGLPTNGSVPSIQAQNIARVLNDRGMLDALGQPPEEDNINLPTEDEETPDSNVSDISDRFIDPGLREFHKNFMQDIADRAQSANEQAQILHDSGILPYEIGDEFSTDKSRNNKQDPWRVVGYVADRKDPERYGYRVERGSGDGYESSTMYVSDPKADIKLRQYPDMADWDRKDHVSQWQNETSGIEHPFVDASADRPIVPNTGYGAHTPYIDQPSEPANDPNYDAFRDTNPPAQSNTFGTKLPEGRNRTSPVKDPEGHEPEGPLPSGFENWFQDSLPENHPMEGLSPEEKLQKGLTEAKPIAREQGEMDSAAKSNQASELAALQGQGGGLSGLGKQMNSLKGPLDNAEFTPITGNFTKADVDTLVNRINGSSHLSPFDKLTAQKGLLKMLNPEGGRVPAKGEIKMLSRVLGGNTVAAMEKAGVKAYKPTSMLGQIWNTVNAAKTIGDWSDLTKSNATMFLTPGYWKAVGTFAKGGLFTEKGYKAARTVLREHPDYHYITRMDIAHTGDAEALGQHEEIFKQNLLEHVPGLRTVMKSSERVYSGVANIVRDHAALRMIEKDRNAGIDVDDPEYLKRAGDLINTLTGRGSFKGSKLGNAFETGMPAISKVLWTPRQYASWAKMTGQAVNPMWWAKASPAMKSQMASGVVSLAGWTVSNLAIASALGYQVHKNVLDPLFGKYKVGDTLYDASAGRASTIHAVAKASMLLATSAEKGRKGDLKTSGDVVMHWMRTHASPAAALIENQFEGKSLRHPINAIGKEQDWLAGNRTNPMGEALTPMSLEGTMDAAHHYGWNNRQTYETGIGEMFGRQATTMDPRKVKLTGGSRSDDPFSDPLFSSGRASKNPDPFNDPVFK